MEKERERERVTEVQFVENTKRVAIVQKQERFLFYFYARKMFFEGVFVGLK